MLPKHPFQYYPTISACLHKVAHQNSVYQNDKLSTGHIVISVSTPFAAHLLSAHPLSAHLLSPHPLHTLCLHTLCKPSVCLSHPFQCNFINTYSSTVPNIMISRRTLLLGVGCCSLVGLLVSSSNLRCSWILRSVGWHLDMDVSGQPIRPILKGKTFQEECFNPYRTNVENRVSS